MKTPPDTRCPQDSLPSFSLPTKAMLTTSMAWPLSIGLLWTCIAWLIGGPSAGAPGLASGAIVAIASMASDWLVRPWQRRTALQWMTLWMVHEACRLACSLGLIILLYFAFSPAPAALLFSYLVCVMAGLAATTRIWTTGMRQELVTGE